MVEPALPALWGLLGHVSGANDTSLASEVCNNSKQQVGHCSIESVTLCDEDGHAQHLAAGLVLQHCLGVRIVLCT